MRQIPDTIFIELTDRCNLSCIMCPCHGTGEMMIEGEGSSLMEKGLYEQIIDELSLYGKEKRITIIPQLRGESCLHPMLPDLLKLTKEKGLHISLNTNATCFNDDIIDAILCYVDSLFISIDAVTEKTFAMIRRGADYSRVMRNIDSLLERRAVRNRAEPVIYTAFVLLGENRNELGQFLSHWHEKADGVMVYQARDIKGHCRSLFRQSVPVNPMPCNNAITSCAILADGRVVPCCNDNLALMVFGNVKEQALAEIYHSKDYEAFRRTHESNDYRKLPLCAHCDIWRWHATVKRETDRWIIHENPPSRLYVKKTDTRDIRR